MEFSFEELVSALEGTIVVNNDNKNFIIRITDDRLLERTNGILQGMSGSPVLQNGKFVGAVTHVFVQDSASGYGIFAETMLEQGG